MSTRTAASQLRLSSARRRIASFIDQIDVLAESSFPHDDGKQVLSTIRERFVELEQLLDLPPTASDDLADRICFHISEVISEYTEILGLVLRSTNVRNAFELHYVLKGMVRQVLDKETDLLISSEWAFVPFTYPIGIELLPDVVLIGSPAPESENPLIVPLAGHEIGHSAWRLTDVEDAFSDRLNQAVDVAIQAHKRVIDEKTNDDDLVTRSSAAVLRDRCAEHALHQLEEIYCDLVGLHLFGPSYLYAFSYLLGPGGSDRSLDYPSDAQRMEILAGTADELGIEVDPALRTQWTASSCPPDQRRFANIVDDAVAALVADLKTHVRDFMDRRGIAPPTASGIEKVYAAFVAREPYPEQASLGEIISAGWKFLQQEAGLAEKDKRATYKVLCDLIWKTIEVAEYLEKKLRSHA